MPSAAPDPEAVARFDRGVASLTGTDDRVPPPADPDVRFGLAVSGGPDSLALLLLAHARFPGRIEAATFDHGFRPESAGEAARVAAICASLDVPHVVLRPDDTLDLADTVREQGGLQALARAWRYRALSGWCRDRTLRWLLTAHHADDQAETVLMRLARGAGPRGLAGIRPSVPLPAIFGHHPTKGQDTRRVWAHRLGRPLLRFSKAELAAIVADAGLTPVSDASNDDPRFDRTHARRLLRDTGWLDPRRLAGVADIMRDTEEALAWTTRNARVEHVHMGEDGYHVDPDGLPAAILHRLCEDVILSIEEAATGGASRPELRGPDLARLIERLQRGEAATLGRVMASPGRRWRFLAAPVHRDRLGRAPRSRASTGEHDPLD